MRIDQYIGLNEWATRKVNKTMWVREMGISILPGGRRKPFNRKVEVPIARRKVIGTIEGAWNPEVANLNRHIMPNGEVYSEYVQEVPWHGGPMYFIALKDRLGKPVAQSLWTEGEMAQY